MTDPNSHYFLPHRLDFEQLLELIEKKYYFVLHAPRQSGKTTAIIEFTKYLLKENKYKALYVSFESARLAANDVAYAVEIILKQLMDKIKLFLPEEKKALSYLENIIRIKNYERTGVYDFLRFWAGENAVQGGKPLVLFFDEFDVLSGDSLIALLTQFRTGYTDRPASFPQTICLVGVRDLRDYKIKTAKPEELGILYSPFNIKAESLTLPDFSEKDVETLYKQHEKETGQIFTEDAISYAFEETQGQPWLVNALAYQACFRDVKDRSQPINKEVMQRSREALIKRCDTHMDALLDRLQEPRVRCIIDTLISSEEGRGFPPDDLQYVRDLGLISRKEIRIANPIYQEIVPRALAQTKQEEIVQEMAWYQNSEGFLDMSKLLQGFTKFYRENAEIWLERFAYKESAPHLLLLAFLQRLINGGGTIHREYALGRSRVDLLISWKTQTFVIEIKVKRGESTFTKGLAQTAEYMDRSNATEGHLVIFDRGQGSWEEKIYHRKEVFQGKTITVWGL